MIPGPWHAHAQYPPADHNIKAMASDSRLTRSRCPCMALSHDPWLSAHGVSTHTQHPHTVLLQGLHLQACDTHTLSTCMDLNLQVPPHDMCTPGKLAEPTNSGPQSTRTQHPCSALSHGLHLQAHGVHAPSSFAHTQRPCTHPMISCRPQPT